MFNTRREEMNSAQLETSLNDSSGKTTESTVKSSYSAPFYFVLSLAINEQSCSKVSWKSDFVMCGLPCWLLQQFLQNTLWYHFEPSGAA